MCEKFTNIGGKYSFPYRGPVGRRPGFGDTSIVNQRRCGRDDSDVLSGGGRARDDDGAKAVLRGSPAGPASVAASAGVFCPNALVAISASSRARLTATTSGGTVSVNAVSYVAVAYAAVCSACLAAVLSQVTWGAAAAAIAADDGPRQCSSANPEMTDP